MCARPAIDRRVGSDINLFGVSSLYLPLSLYPPDFSLPISLSVLLLRVIHAGVAVAPASPPSLITLNNRCATCHLVPRRLAYGQESAPPNYVSLCFPRRPFNKWPLVDVVNNTVEVQRKCFLRIYLHIYFIYLFIYFFLTDSREETVLGSIPLPSYVIAPVEPDDHINRKYAFKVTVKWH